MEIKFGVVVLSILLLFSFIIVDKSQHRLSFFPTSLDMEKILDSPNSCETNYNYSTVFFYFI